MSLNRQLWFVIAVLMALAFGGSFAVSGWSAKAYLEQELSLKNADNANALVLSLAAAGDDPTALELLLAAQYDTGHYALLRLEGPQLHLAFGAAEAGPVAGVPDWFVRRFPIRPEPGVAQLSQGWQALGTLELQSESRFAYLELWRSSQRLLAYFSTLTALGTLACTLLLRWITRPLAAVVEQAEAIGERRFITIPEPRTREFGALSRAMNALSRRVQQMLIEESERLGRWHRQSLTDPLTGLLAREPFLERLAALLKHDDASAQGAAAILRVLHLSELNRRHGRAVMDALLRRLGRELQAHAELYEGLVAGRLNGSELAVVVPEHGDAAALATQLREALLAAGRELSVDALEIAAAATLFGRSDTVPQLLQRADEALAAVEQRQGGGVEIADPQTSVRRSSQYELGRWSELLAAAFAGGRFRLETYPVRDRQRALLHEEAFCRLLAEDGSELCAGEFMPWAARLGRLLELDHVVVAAALRRIEETSQPLAVNLSVRLLADAGALSALIEQVRAAPRAAPLLWLELPERGVYARLEGFRQLCSALRPLGCRLGIEHAGSEVAQMGALYDVGLHYVKLEASVVRGIEHKPGHQAFVRGLCTIAHSIGLSAIAEAVETEDEWRALLELGIDGGTGRGLRSGAA